MNTPPPPIFHFAPFLPSPLRHVTPLPTNPLPPPPRHQCPFHNILMPRQTHWRRVGFSWFVAKDYYICSQLKTALVQHIFNLSSLIISDCWSRKLTQTSYQSIVTLMWINQWRYFWNTCLQSFPFPNFFPPGIWSFRSLGIFVLFPNQNWFFQDSPLFCGVHFQTWILALMGRFSYVIHCRGNGRATAQSVKHQLCSQMVMPGSSPSISSSRFLGGKGCERDPGVGILLLVWISEFPIPLLCFQSAAFRNLLGEP